NYKVSHPGDFTVELVTSQQKNGAGWDGGQHVKVATNGKDLPVTVAEDRKEINPANPYWPYVVTKVGSVHIDKTGTYTLSLKPESIPDGQKFGLTVVSVRLTPAAK